MGQGDNKKVCSVLWSGGLDSTLMILDLLRNDYKVRALQITSESFLGSSMEKKRTGLIEPFLKNIGDFSYQITHQDICCRETFTLPQAPILLLNLSLFANSNDEFCSIGYVMNDDAISFIPEITKIWKSYKQLKPNLPPLKFPLMKRKKRELINYMRTECMEIYNLCWYCENPKEETPCLVCPSCIRHINTEKECVE